jgi:hypothetical protein
MSDFTRPVSNLANDALGYAGAKLDNIKLRSVKALSKGTGTIFWFALVLLLVGILLLTLSFGLVMWLGEKMGSYALGAFIVAGGVAVLLILVLLLRKVLFRGTFVPTFSKAFFPKEDRIRSHHSLENAILRNEVDLNNQEMLMSRSFGDAKQFYANPRLAVDGISSAVGWVSSLFAKKKEEKQEEREQKKEERAHKKEEKAQKKEEKKEQKVEKKAEKKDKEDKADAGDE